MYKNIFELWGSKTIPEVALVEHMASQEVGFSVKNRTRVFLRPRYAHYVFSTKYKRDSI